jgi:tRNA(His) guanylyltransferase
MGSERFLLAAPMFDGRAVLYPSEAVLRDYLSWRQVDTHINNQASRQCVLWTLAREMGRWPRLIPTCFGPPRLAQYNTCFWALVKQGGRTPTDAQNELKGTDVNFKNEMLFSEFGINYNALPEQFKKGSIVIRRKCIVVVKTDAEGRPIERERVEPVVLHCDIIRDEFWREHPELLA